VQIWINPSCSKCRAAVTELEACGVTFVARRYLEDPPSEAELTATLEALGMQPWDLARTGEAVAAELGLADLARDAATRTEWIRLLAAHPILIQRPILVAADGTAFVGRDAGNLAAAIAHERG
jgi:arsenate reductase